MNTWGFFHFRCKSLSQTPFFFYSIISNIQETTTSLEIKFCDSHNWISVSLSFLLVLKSPSVYSEYRTEAVLHLLLEVTSLVLSASQTQQQDF